jgi:LmbE family N-acetylglucosaminyl deacetylase
MPTQQVYLAPHADDETLSMGLHIENQRRKGNPCHVILMSDGGDTGADKVLNGALSNPPVNGCVIHGYSHHPVNEFYASGGPLQDSDIGAARRKEFVSTLGAMATGPTDGSIVPGEITYEFAGFADSWSGGLPPSASAVDDTEAFMLDVISRFPGAQFYTMSESDQQGDHAACGKALRRIKNSTPGLSVNFFVSKLYWKDNNGGVYPAPLLAVTSNGTTLNWIDSHDFTGTGYADCSNHLRNRVIKIYMAGWSPAAGVYGIGGHSVKPQFDNCFGAGINVFNLMHP